MNTGTSPSVQPGAPPGTEPGQQQQSRPGKSQPGQYYQQQLPHSGGPGGPPGPGPAQYSMPLQQAASQQVQSGGKGGQQQQQFHYVTTAIPGPPGQAAEMASLSGPAGQWQHYQQQQQQMQPQAQQQYIQVQQQQQYAPGPPGGPGTMIMMNQQPALQAPGYQQQYVSNQSQSQQPQNQGQVNNQNQNNTMQQMGPGPGQQQGQQNLSQNNSNQIGQNVSGNNSNVGSTSKQPNPYTSSVSQPITNVNRRSSQDQQQQQQQQQQQLNANRAAQQQQQGQQKTNQSSHVSQGSGTVYDVHGRGPPQTLSQQQAQSQQQGPQQQTQSLHHYQYQQQLQYYGVPSNIDPNSLEAFQIRLDRCLEWTIRELKANTIPRTNNASNSMTIVNNAANTMQKNESVSLSMGVSSSHSLQMGGANQIGGQGHGQDQISQHNLNSDPLTARHCHGPNALPLNHFIVACNRPLSRMENDQSVQFVDGDRTLGSEIFTQVEDCDVVLLLADLLDPNKLQRVVALTALFDSYAHSPPILVVHVSPIPIERNQKLYQYIVETTEKLLQIGSDNVIWRGQTQMGLVDSTREMALRSAQSNGQSDLQGNSNNNPQQYDPMLEPPMRGCSLLFQIEMSLMRVQNNMSRMSQQLQLNQSSINRDLEYVERIESKYYRLLWHYVFRRSFVHFPACDPSLDALETAQGVDNWVFESIISEFLLGVLWKAHDKTTKVQRAIKVVAKNRIELVGELEGIYREYRILSAIVRHPNIIRCHTMLHSTNNLYFVMDFVAGPDLSQIMSSFPNRETPEAEISTFLSQILLAIGHCHQNLISHRDLKPEAISVDRKSGLLKICDFSSSVSVKDTKKTLATPCGTFPYSAPEAFCCTKDYCGTLADVWSLGIILLEMIIGAHMCERLLIEWQSGFSPAHASATTTIIKNPITGQEERVGHSGPLMDQLQGLSKPIPVEFRDRIEAWEIQGYVGPSGTNDGGTQQDSEGFREKSGNTSDGRTMNASSSSGNNIDVRDCPFIPILRDKTDREYDESHPDFLSRFGDRKRRNLMVDFFGKAEVRLPNISQEQIQQYNIDLGDKDNISECFRLRQSQPPIPESILGLVHQCLIVNPECRPAVNRLHLPEAMISKHIAANTPPRSPALQTWKKADATASPCIMPHLTGLKSRGSTGSVGIPGIGGPGNSNSNNPHVSVASNMSNSMGGGFRPNTHRRQSGAGDMMAGDNDNSMMSPVSRNANQKSNRVGGDGGSGMSPGNGSGPGKTNKGYRTEQY